MTSEPKSVRDARAEIVARVEAGDLSIADVHEQFQREARAEQERERRHVARLRFGDPNKPKAKRAGTPEPPVPQIAGPIRVDEVLAATPGLDARLARLILDEYEFDGSWQIGEIGSAEASVLDSAVRLVLHRPRPRR